MDDLLKAAATQVVESVAGKLGAQVDAAQVVELGEKILGYAADIIAAHGWKHAHATGTAAAATITTEAQAEAAQRKP